jgi:VanZ family protein
MKKFLQNSRWAVVWGLFIIILHLLPGKVFPRIPTFFDLLAPDKLVHVGMFGVFVFLMLHAFNHGTTHGISRKYPVITAFVIALSLGVILELVQNYLIPNRFGSIYDEIADLVGCLLGWGLWMLWKKLTAKTQRR